ncbi:MAG: ribosomal protein S18-alanine N-acetyltransferase [Thermoprotei archaeon]
MSVEIRPADVSEIDDVIMLNRVNLPENYPTQFFYEILSQFPKTFIIAKHGLQTIGYIMIRVEKSLSVLRWVNRAHVISITVHKAFRRQGIGERLMLTACNNAYTEYKATEVYLEVRVTNMPAISLYKKLGFEIKEVSRGYYSDGEDAYVMQAQLPLRGGDSS